MMGEIQKCIEIKCTFEANDDNNVHYLCKSPQRNNNKNNFKENMFSSITTNEALIIHVLACFK